jgi:thiol-disulfide isomerase/thioredoxin
VSSDASDASTTQPQGIDWYSGTLEQAFASAKAANKPLFLYWGADWCPYCNELKANIFIRDEFIDLSRQFIPVDLSNGDDDADDILHAEKFKVAGLPTVIVFSPEGEEITRIAGGADMQQYAAVLELTLNSIRPVSQLVEALIGGGEVSDQDWQLLAAYSWGQDRGRALGDDKPSDLLQQLMQACPTRLAASCSQLSLASLDLWLGEDTETRNAEMQAVYLQAVNGILLDASLTRTNLLSLAYMGSSIVENLLEAPEQRATLRAQLLGVYTQALENTELNVLNRASVLSGWSELAASFLPEGQSLTPEVVTWGKTHADDLLAELNPYQQHAGVNSLWGVYYELGLKDEARAALQHGIKVSKTPFYFMSGMAYIERKDDNNELALEWYRKAWEATREPMHKTRWGAGYVRRLLQLGPDQTAEIERASTAVLQDLLAQKKGLQLYKRRIEGLSESLLKWAEEESGPRGKVLVGLKTSMTNACSELAPETLEATPCATFLSEPDNAA